MEAPMRKVKLPVLAAVILGIGVLALPTQVQAQTSPYTCTVQNIVYDGRLFIDCVGTATRFIGYPGLTYPVNGSPCGTNQYIDGVKIWESMATSALMSGATVTIVFASNCDGAGNGGIQVVQLN